MIYWCDRCKVIITQDRNKSLKAHVEQDDDFDIDVVRGKGGVKKGYLPLEFS